MDTEQEKNKILNRREVRVDTEQEKNNEILNRREVRVDTEQKKNKEATLNKRKIRRPH